MKNIYKSGLFFCLLITLLAAWRSPARVNQFTASYYNEGVRLDWSLAENDVSQFELHRKDDDDQTYSKVTNVSPNLSGQYHYLDKGLYEDELFLNELEYRLTAIHDSSQVFYYTTISSAPTAFERSWDSIKSMFR
ncbi:hypothetical protein SAMN05421823_11735 [Catalinimonas alkaloidigena]|uniref:Uncharacterized protein n=1 Tax=Catalinimonas alkaloidigena TaxID=1075417 RepID=A0A1G9UPP9_9BACT|nr:hypothetical protein [Catalinimonas alkaloidigena]SDM61836.1 hypothetical protein SAMN05421823_11735 [Catalinimonas alkaloidigena]